MAVRVGGVEEGSRRQVLLDTARLNIPEAAVRGLR
jgi:hypothetical protein